MFIESINDMNIFQQYEPLLLLVYSMLTPDYYIRKTADFGQFYLQNEDTFCTTWNLMLMQYLALNFTIDLSTLMGLFVNLYKFSSTALMLFLYDACQVYRGSAVLRDMLARTPAVGSVVRCAQQLADMEIANATLRKVVAKSHGNLTNFLRSLHMQALLFTDATPPTKVKNINDFVKNNVLSLVCVSCTDIMRSYSTYPWNSCTDSDCEQLLKKLYNDMFTELGGINITTYLQ